MFLEASEEIIIQTNEQKLILESYLKVKDLSQFELKIDTKAVIFGEEDTNRVKTLVADIYRNEEGDHFEVVFEKVTQDKLDETMQEALEAQQVSEEITGYRVEHWRRILRD